MSTLVYPFGDPTRDRRGADKGRYQTFSQYPSTEQGWADRYDRLWCAYLQEPYDIGEISNFHLFRALDDNGNEIDITRRMFDLYRFIVDTDVGGLLGKKLLLESEGPGASLVDGETIWRRSRVVGQIERWARTLAAMGDYYIEAVRSSGKKPYGTRLVGYDPRCVVPEYDGDTGTELVGATITTRYQDPSTVRADGTVEEGATHEYRREIDATGITVYRDGKPISAGGAHGLGVVPLVHATWCPWTEPEHGLPAPAGLDAAVMRLDSLMCQIGAVGNRYANPKPVLSGAKLGDSSDVEQFGRWLHGLPIDAKAYYLESSGAGVDSLLKAIATILEHVRKTAPEFLFADEGATSGEARSYKAAAFENKIENARTRFFGAISRATYYAVAMDAGTAADPDAEPFCVDAGPILPRNTKSELEALYLAKDDLKRADRVRRLQAIGMLDPTLDPDEYAAEVEDEAAERAAQFFTPPGGGASPRPGDPGFKPPATEDE